MKNELFVMYRPFWTTRATHEFVELEPPTQSRTKLVEQLSKCKRVKNTTLYISCCPLNGSLNRVVVITLF